ncbi:hypothetical protein MKW92_038663 [Papaver armeniacum]|nr:hypothetical protein MKW92_038663 [Papaver armeniacum]
MEKSIVSGNTEYISISSSSSVVRSNFTEDILKCEILTRLPVKSLMRFKCVSKTWLSLIEQDPYFADLHFERSKARPALLLVIPLRNKNLDKISDELILTANLSRDRSKAEIQNILKTQLFSCNKIRGPVNGLVCFVDRANSDVRVYNISTREVTERIRSTLLMQDPRSFHTTVNFGFDPVTRKHKVLCVYRSNPQPVQKHLDDQYKACCEVLTAGEDVWRRIDEVPPCDIGFPSVYVNGSIYYCTSKFMSGNWVNNDAVLVAFDVGSEIFRSITIPNLILNNRSSNSNKYHCAYLLEVDGHIAIAYMMSAYIVKLWVYRENTEYDIKGKKPKSTNLGSREANWTEDTITLPFPWEITLWWSFYTGAGKHQILVQSEKLNIPNETDTVTQYSYDLKKKTFTKIEVCGIPSSIPNDCRIKLTPTFVESLFPIQKQRSSSGVRHSNIQQERELVL